MDRLSKSAATVCMVAACLAGSARCGPFDDGENALSHGDYVTALRLLKPLAEQGNAEAQAEVARLYLLTAGEAQSAAWAWKFANQGSAPARDWLILLCTGVGDLGNPVPEVRCDQVLADVKALATHGDAEAETQLGSLYLRGSGVPKDPAQGVTWLRKAADQGNSAAQLRLGALYGPLGGLDVQEDDVQSLSWYRKAANRGNAQAMHELAFHYERGLGGAPKDEAQAAVWYRKAAEKGDTLSETELAEIYTEGRGLPKDAAQAFYWNRQLAYKGFKVNQATIGADYALGKGVAQDYVQAYVWLDVAVASEESFPPGTFVLAVFARDSALAHLTPAQVAEAKQISAALTAKLKDCPLACLSRANVR